MTSLRRNDYDVVVVGSGVAGLATALGLAGLCRVAVVTGAALGGGSTSWAQGGLAAALGADDCAALHAADTMTAGTGFGDLAAVQILADSAPCSLAELLRFGARLDRDRAGRLALTREGGHSARRVVHAGGDASGAEVSRALTAAIRRADIEIFEDAEVREVLTSAAGAAAGITFHRPDGDRTTIRAGSVVLATGGVGGLFAASTNPPEVRGTGLGLALRAGATLVDLEFIQFHPTALDCEGSSGQVPLITEALRGEGAVLTDDHGRSVMAGRHPLADLAPRDVVARRIDEVRAGGSRVWLDATGVDDVAHRFPTVAASCRAQGIDPECEPIPVAPAQHFLCGGIRTDSWGATDVPQLYAVGETAATGVHGANRLASNSLVEGLVYGRRVAARIALTVPTATTAGVPNSRRVSYGVGLSALPQIRQTLQTAAGIRRAGAGLETARGELAALVDRRAHAASDSTADNEWLAATAVVAAAAERRESRGCHWRGDHPASSNLWRHRRVVVRLDSSGWPIATTESIEQKDRRLDRTA
jgi:L-aspartate oxidase